jgi:hypothetical protein
VMKQRKLIDEFVLDPTTGRGMPGCRAVQAEDNQGGPAPLSRPRVQAGVAVASRHAHRIVLDDRESSLLEEIRGDPQFRGLSDAETVRFCFFRWYAEQHMRGPKQLKTAI